MIATEGVKLSLSVVLNRTLPKLDRVELEDELLRYLSPAHFAFERGELKFLDADDLQAVLPLIRDMVDTVWNRDGKDVTDLFLPVFGVYETRCPACGSDSELDVDATIAVRLTRRGPSLEDARDQSVRWDDDSACRCACGWSGSVADTK